MSETAPKGEAAAPDIVRATPSKLSPSGYSNHAIHLVRTVQNNTLALSQMADQKASILMGATFLVFSISVSRSLAGDLPWSLALLAGFAFASSLCAVMAVLPAIGKPKGPAPGTVQRPNPLFFGSFANRDEDEWRDEVLELLKGDEEVFSTMLHDIYQNGMVLQHKKYRYLTLAYRIFIIGLVLTMIAFIIEMAITY
ncbi:MAG: Pycsar system effector family protein [Alteripontixanthobacter sp.]